MEHGLVDSWADGVCCTGVLAKGDPAAIVAAFGRASCVYDGAKVIRADLPKHVNVYALKPTSTEWCLVEIPGDDDIESDYLRPLYDDVLTLFGDSHDHARRYETPVATARFLSKKLGIETCAIWASDESPGLLGAAFFEGGEVDLILTGFSESEIRKESESRRKLIETGELDDEEEDFDEDAPGFGEQAFRIQAGNQEDLEAEIEDVLDAELKERKAVWDNTDLLRDWAGAIVKEIADAATDVEALWLAE